MNEDSIALILINLLTVIPPTIMALAALKSSQRVEKQVATDDGGPTIAEATISQDSTLKIAAAILDRMDERLEAVEKTQVQSMKWHDDHEAWHNSGRPERRKTPRDPS